MIEIQEKAYEQLKKERETQGLSLADAANALHLNISIIEQIELGDFSSRHLAPVFMRGYVRSYAKYLNLSEAMIVDLMKDLEKTLPAEFVSPKLQPKPLKEVNIKSLKKIGLYSAVVILIILFSFIWPHSQSNKLSSPSTETLSLSSNENSLNNTDEQSSKVNLENTNSNTSLDQTSTPINTTSDEESIHSEEKA